MNVKITWERNDSFGKIACEKLSHEKLILKKKKLEENKWTCGECENESFEKKLILGKNACENINIILKKELCGGK